MANFSETLHWLFNWSWLDSNRPLQVKICTINFFFYWCMVYKQLLSTFYMDTLSSLSVCILCVHICILFGLNYFICNLSLTPVDLLLIPQTLSARLLTNSKHKCNLCLPQNVQMYFLNKITTEIRYAEYTLQLVLQYQQGLLIVKKLWKNITACIAYYL